MEWKKKELVGMEHGRDTRHTNDDERTQANQINMHIRMVNGITE